MSIDPLIELLPIARTGSTIRSAQVLSVFCAMVVLFLGIGCIFGIRTKLIEPLSGNTLEITCASLLFDVLVVLGWTLVTRTHRKRAIQAWMDHGDSEGLRMQVVSGWATQRVRFVKPLIFATLIGLLGAGFASSQWSAAVTTFTSMGILVWAFPTKKRAAIMLEQVQAAAEH